MSTGQSEAFSRVMIDKALEFSGWNLLDPKQVVFELHSGAGRTDYLLKDKLGHVLCVLEAIEVGPEGEKVDVMTFRGSFERDVREFVERDAEMKAAVADEDDDTVDTLMNERFEDYENARVLVVDCKKSPTPVYVKDGNMEHFFIRTGATTTELTGNQMQQFIKHRFR